MYLFLEWLGAVLVGGLLLLGLVGFCVHRIALVVRRQHVIELAYREKLAGYRRAVDSANPSSARPA